MHPRFYDKSYQAWERRGVIFMTVCLVAWLVYVAFVVAEDRQTAAKCRAYADSVRIRPDQVVRDCPYD